MATTKTKAIFAAGSVPVSQAIIVLANYFGGLDMTTEVAAAAATVLGVVLAYAAAYFPANKEVKPG